jgi:hypothetical protein
LDVTFPLCLWCVRDRLLMTCFEPSRWTSSSETLAAFLVR